MNKIIITTSVRFEGVPIDQRAGYMAKVRRALETLVKNHVLWRPLHLNTTLVVNEDNSKEERRGS